MKELAWRRVISDRLATKGLSGMVAFGPQLDVKPWEEVS